MEDENAKSEHLEVRIQQLEKEREINHRENLKEIEQKQKWFDNELQRLRDTTLSEEDSRHIQETQELKRAFAQEKETLENALFVGESFFGNPKKFWIFKYIKIFELVRGNF